MSTARTTVGCMAEDYAAELAAICRIHATTKRLQVNNGYVLDEGERRMVDVADSFDAAVKR